MRGVGCGRFLSRRELRVEASAKRSVSGSVDLDAPWLARAGFKALSVVFALLLLSSLASRVAAASTPADESAAYRVHAVVDYQSGRVDVDEAFSYKNQTGDTLVAVVLNAMPAHFGVFSLKSASAAGRASPAKLTGVDLEIPLAANLAPGQSIDFAISYRLDLPSPGDLRFGRSGGVTRLGNWLPVVELYRAGRWTRHPYSTIGDPFATECAEYDVTLDVIGAPATLAIAHSGDLVEHAGTRWHFHGSRIRDFALALSDRYHSMSTQVGKTAVTAYFRPEHAGGARRMLATAAATVRWADDNLGLYPYATLDVAEVPGPTDNGQEYPNLVFIGDGSFAPENSTSPDDPPVSSTISGATDSPAVPASSVGSTGPGVGPYLDYIVAHEVIHQWFYGLVGNDQVESPWLDEGPTVHLTYLFLKEYDPPTYARMWPGVARGYASALAAGGEVPIDAPTSAYADEARYFALLYRGTALFLEEVRQRLGTPAYLALLRDFVAEHRFGIVKTRDLLGAIRARAGDGIAPLARQRFSADSYRAAFESPLVSLPAAAPVAESKPVPVATPSPPGAPPALSPVASETVVATLTPHLPTAGPASVESTAMPADPLVPAPTVSPTTITPTEELASFLSRATPTPGEPPVGAASGILEGSASVALPAIALGVAGLLLTGLSIAHWRRRAARAR